MLQVSRGYTIINQPSKDCVNQPSKYFDDFFFNSEFKKNQREFEKVGKDEQSIMIQSDKI
jgi:hypothetical protein